MDSLEECDLPPQETAHTHHRHHSPTVTRDVNWTIPGAFEDPFLKYFKTQTVEYGKAASCVFLLLGSLPLSRSSTCSVMKAIDVPIRGTDDMDAKGKRVDEDEVFQSMRRAFYKSNNSLASYIGLRTVCAVRPIKFRLIKLHESRILVSLLAEDWLAESRGKCQASMAKIGEQLEQYKDAEGFCYPNPDTSGGYTHIHSSCGFADPTLPLTPVCPFEDFDSWESRLNWLDTIPFFTLYFLHPDAAKGQTILSSPFSVGYRYQYSNIRFLRERERRFLVLDGLYVEEQWKTSRAIPLVVAVLFLTLVVSRLVWKSWEVVFGAASFVTAAIMLVYSIHED